VSSPGTYLATTALDTGIVLTSCFTRELRASASNERRSNVPP
jgi:hypothetical protein